MKIALLTDGISPYVLGGMQRHSFYITKYLAQQQIHVDLFHFNQSELNIDNLECFSDEEKKFIRSIVVPFPSTIKFPGHYIYNSFLYSKLIFKLIKPDLDKYNFIYTKGFVGWKLIKEKARGLKCPPIGINVHGYEMYQHMPSIKSIPSILLLRLFIKPLIDKSDKVFSYGGKITDLLINRIKVPFSKIIELSGGIEESWINESVKSESEVVRFVFLGRAERRKGIEELNEVLDQIKDVVNFKFTFIGPIPVEEQIKHPKITYLGEIRDVTVIKEQMFLHDILVCPSHSEGMPNVILEAMANQLAIIATDVGAVNLMVNAENGWLMTRVETLHLKKSLIEATKLDPVKLKELQKISLAKIKEKFLWNKIIMSLIPKINHRI